ncbi:hypothetical protein QR680_002271 [Steinernema hermaphroditum]|uniref:Netrin receptor UNC5 n=1 Tax=Steinernema hermaphroditum TaxID=289476 RepID=A0AA39LI00_9BILA|nr:hypothetical protein QR680_002271 [Steinernema hermaphroditum]
MNVMLLRLFLLLLFQWNLVRPAVLRMDDEIIILESPTSGYITRGKAATLRCRALRATKIVFKCNSQWLDENSVITRRTVDPSSSLSVLEATAEISRIVLDSVGDYSGALQCQCYASDNSDVRVVRSDTAHLRLAYIRKHFYNFPTSEKVPEGRTVQLQCAAPDADPKAEIFWLKDGKQIERSVDSNIILANDGSLIISAVRLLDSGNYTCEARNIASRRSTEPAEINVYVDGQWSIWSAWSGSCRIECDWLARALSIHAGDSEATYKILPRLRRNRVCNNPAPLHGGAPCEGEEEQFQECDHKCKIDGQWSVWTPWSDCSAQCRRLRTRTCTAPPPFNGGLSCSGNDVESVNCTSPSFTCNPNNSIFGLQASNRFITQDQAVVMAAAVAVVLLAGIVCILTAMILFRRRICGTSRKEEDGYFSHDSGDVRSVLRNRTPKTLLSEIDPSESHMGLNSPNFLSLGGNGSGHYVPTSTLRSGKSYNSGYSTRKYSGSRTALLGEYSSSNSSSAGKPVLLRSDSRMSDDNYATLYDIGGDEGRCYSTAPCEQDQSATMVAAHGDSNGLIIEMGRSGAALTIGEDSLSEERMIRLAVSDDVGERPPLPSRETYLSCVIAVELCETEPETVLRRPYVVTFDHCASLFPKDNWQFLLYAKWNKGPYDTEEDWELVSIHGEENINTSVHVQVERERCHVMSERFGRFILTGRPKKAHASSSKRVRLAVYGPRCQQRSELPLRVYCVPETRMAIETVRKQEEEHGVLLSESSNFLLKENGALCVCLEDISTGYALDGTSKYLEISELQHMWCSQNGLHCSLHVKVAEDMINSLAGRIVIYQKNNGSDRQILEFHLRHPAIPTPPRGEDKLVSSQFQLGADVKRKLASLLDPPLDENRDWRGLARKLNINNFVQYFATQSNSSPTLLLFDLWEACVRGSPRAVLDLLQTLRVMGRADTVRVLDHETQMEYDFVHSP